MPRISFSSDGTFQIIEKAGPKIVRTLAGVKRYGVGIGQQIVPKQPDPLLVATRAAKPRNEGKKAPPRRRKATTTQSTPRKVKQQMKASEKKQPAGVPTDKASRRKPGPMVVAAERSARRRGGSAPLNRDTKVTELKQQVKEIKAKYGIKGNRTLATLLDPNGPVKDAWERESLAQAVLDLISETPHRTTVANKKKNKDGSVSVTFSLSRNSVPSLLAWAKRKANAFEGLDQTDRDEAVGRAMRRFTEEWLDAEGGMPRAIATFKKARELSQKRGKAHTRGSGLGKEVGISDLDDYMDTARWRLGAAVNSELKSQAQRRGNAGKRPSKKQLEEGTRRVHASLEDAATAKNAEKRLRDRKSAIDNADPFNSVPTLFSLALTSKQGELVRGKGKRKLSPSAEKLAEAMRYALRPAFDEVGDFSGVITIEIPDENNPGGTRPIRRSIDFDMDDMRGLTGLEILAVMVKESTYSDEEISQAFKNAGKNVSRESITQARKSGLARIKRRMEDRALAQYFDDQAFEIREQGYKSYEDFRRRVAALPSENLRRLTGDAAMQNEVLSIISQRVKAEPENRSRLIAIANEVVGGGTATDRDTLRLRRDDAAERLNAIAPDPDSALKRLEDRRKRRAKVARKEYDDIAYEYDQRKRRNDEIDGRAIERNEGAAISSLRRRRPVERTLPSGEKVMIPAYTSVAEMTALRRRRDSAAFASEGRPTGQEAEIRNLMAQIEDYDRRLGEIGERTGVVTNLPTVNDDPIGPSAMRDVRSIPERRETIAVPRPRRGSSSSDAAPVTAAVDRKAEETARPFSNAGKATSNPDLRQLADSLAEHHKSRLAQVERLKAQGVPKSSDEYKAAESAVAESKKSIEAQLKSIKTEHKISVAVDKKTGIPTASQLRRAVVTDKTRSEKSRPTPSSDTSGGGFVRVTGKPMEEMTMRQISAEISGLQTEIRESGGDLSTPINRDKNNRIARLRDHKSRRRSGELKMVRKSVLNLLTESESDMVIAL